MAKVNESVPYVNAVMIKHNGMVISRQLKGFEAAATWFRELMGDPFYVGEGPIHLLAATSEDGKTFWSASPKLGSGFFRSFQELYHLDPKTERRAQVRARRR